MKRLDRRYETDGALKTREERSVRTSSAQLKISNPEFHLWLPSSRIFNAHGKAVIETMQKNCSNCGKDFHCGATRATAEAGEELSCWCTELPRVGVVAGADQDCLCPDCLTDAIGKLATDSPCALKMREEGSQR